MSESLYLISICVIAATFLAVFGLKTLSAHFIAKAQSSKEADYRAITLKVASASADVSAQLTLLSEELRDVKERVIRIEKILKDVDS